MSSRVLRYLSVFGFAVLAAFAGSGLPASGEAQGLHSDRVKSHLVEAAPQAESSASESVVDHACFPLDTRPHKALLPLIVTQRAEQPPSYHVIPNSATCVPNAGVSYYNGAVRDRAGNLQNWVCVHVAFYGPRTTKCSGCDGVGDGQWGFAPFGGPAPANIPVEIFIVPCPASVPAGGLSSDFGDLTPLSDKWLYTTSSTSMQCTGITFVQN